MDSEMPKLDGRSAATQLRRMGASDVIIVGCTGNALEEE
jgi:CheY-like chemotaxis protein